MRILKFGGSSVANPDSIRKVKAILENYVVTYPSIAIVVSAQAGITNLLIQLCESISSDPEAVESIIQKIEFQHLNAARELLPVTDQPASMAELMTTCNELSEIVRGASMVGEVTPRTHDLILSFGERLSAYLMAQILKQVISRAKFADARQFIITDSSFGSAKVDFEISNSLIRKYFSLTDGIPVITGFTGSTPDGKTTTLGRSGSDYTASIIGAALDAEIIEIWSDADGVMTCDPALVEEARTIPNLTYAEAMELSHFGAKILFPASIIPAMRKQIPLIVKNTFNPDHQGTLISAESTNANGFIKGITSLKDIAMINVEGSGMVGVSGTASRIFSALSGESISVILISQASSEHSICLGIHERDAERACTVISSVFAGELERGLITSVNYEPKLAIVAVVGENMRSMPGVAARVFSPLGRNGINIKAISQGSSELNISFVISSSDLKKTINILHQSLFSREIRKLHLYIAGTGSVGSRLLQMISDQKEYLIARQIELKVSGLINSRKMLSSEDHIDPSSWKELMNKNSAKADFGSFIDSLLRVNFENSVFVDVTASDEPVGYYRKLLSSNIAIVAANKRANTGFSDNYLDLHQTARKRRVPFHYETNVGAGLPVINTLRDLMAGGDKILRIEGVLSGTINWLLSEYDGTTPFSELVRIARNMGLTEPNPADDLSGTDVARKCLILARESGMMIDLEDVEVESLLPEGDEAVIENPDRFFELLRLFDDPFDKLYKESAYSGKKLKYVASIENGNAKVKLQSVDNSHPFHSLSGSGNCLILTTEFYKESPMVISGPGAGINVTSAGLLADIVRVAEGIRI